MFELHVAAGSLVSWVSDGRPFMTSLLTIFALGITVLVPAAVWTLLAVGLFELIRDWVHKREPRVAHGHVARLTRS